MYEDSNILTQYYLTNEPEGQYFDRKSAKLAPKEIAKHIAAFANANGGILAIGIEDNGQITGFNYPSAHSINDFLTIPYSCLRQCPSVTCETLNFTINNIDYEVLIIRIDSSNSKIIYTTDGKVYLRIGDSSKSLNHEQITRLEYDKGERYFEDLEVPNSSIHDVDEDLISLYKDKLNTTKSTHELLEARGLLINDHLTNAGVLLFGKNPTKFIPNARMRFLKYDGNKSETGERLNLIKEISFDEAIPKIIMKSREAINLQLRDFQFLNKEGVFETIPEYPEFAWFEGIVNALTHRDYSIRGEHVRISMYNNRLEISSPGSLPNIVTLKNMKNTRYSRNPRIARTLCEFGWVKELNEGVNRIFDEMQLFFLKDPVYSEPNNNSVLLILDNSITSRILRTEIKTQQLLGSKIYSELSEHELAIIRFLMSNKKITVSQAKILIKKSLPYTRKLLSRLYDNHILEWHGSNKQDPTQYYTLNH